MEQDKVEGGLDDPTQLEPEQGSLALAGPDDQHSRAEWEQATAAVLRKARRMSDDDSDDLVWSTLTRTTLDGVEITPLGTPDHVAEGASAARPLRQGEWDIRAHLAAGEAKLVREEALVDLEGGVTSLWLGVDDAAGGPAHADFWASALDGVLLDLAPVVLDAAGDRVGVARAFLEHAEGTTLPPATNLGLDAADPEQTTAEAARLALDAGVLGFVVDATRVHDQGASDVQELAWAMATAAGYLRRLDEAGIGVTQAVALLEFRFAVSDEQFTAIAKLRAARTLWDHLQTACDVETPTDMRQHAVTSRPMMTRYDPWVNMLRTTVAAFAAGVAGADSVTVLPFDSALGRPDAFGRRIARNTSALLISESHLARVSDPAGGAYAVEKLTRDTAEAAWELFVRLDDGEDLAPLVAATVEQREQQVATRTRPLTGLSEFPHLAEDLPERPAYEEFAGVRPWGASFEALRDDPPAAHVFLATLGSVAAHTARATFATNLFAAGGVAVDVAGATDGVDDLLAAYDGQGVVCLAGADPAYAEWGEQAAAALREAGARTVVIAGKPVDYADDSCAMGVDALDFLTRTRGALQ